ncbi:RNA polymerase factor sigma-54 [Consotaella aegiceratis]|uniref:RNA polymerase factor sigma-54 n=1 Tax=Consotaella aegiceratis TaxID=3097961 RepID=UPI002F3ECC5B
MMLSAKLQLRQAQSLVMTPQLLQSIRLLQFNHLELRSFIESEAERNPLIELVEAGSETSQDGVYVSSAPRDATATVTRSDGEAPATARGGETGWTGGDGSTASQDSSGWIEDLPETGRSLIAHAEAEVAQVLRDPIDRAIAQALLDHLDEAGYLRCASDVVAAGLGVELGRLEQVIKTLQREVEPAGLFARDLGECLALQLARLGRLDPVIERVLANLDLLARRDFAGLKRLTGEDEMGLMEILKEIRQLDPKPGRAFSQEPAAPIVPDVLLTRAADGGWRVELNPETLPKVLVDVDYVRRISKHGLPDEERSFVTDCQHSANWLVRSLDQRARTILKVAEEIVRRQSAFLDHGVTHLRPLTLMAVAEAIGMHESTISRVTSNKYIATPRGIFELKYFFTVAIASSAGGDAHSAESVKHRIRQLVDAESRQTVLSDDDIAARLKEEGIDLARRTVAKYREALAIPSSIQRRREMNARQPA